LNHTTAARFPKRQPFIFQSLATRRGSVRFFRAYSPY
jgi:hypothetical protein